MFVTGPEAEACLDRDPGPSGGAATRARGAGLGSRSRARPLQHLYSSLAPNGPVCEQEVFIAPADPF